MALLSISLVPMGYPEENVLDERWRMLRAQGQCLEPGAKIFTTKG